MNNFNDIIGLFIVLNLLYRGKIQGQYATERFVHSQMLSTSAIDHNISREIEPLHHSDSSRFTKYSETSDVNFLAQRNIGHSRRLSTSHRMNRPSDEQVKINNKNIGFNVALPKTDDENSKNYKPNVKVTKSNAMGNVTVVETTVAGGNATTSNGTVVTFDERSNFNGDKCPTGYVKINGKCVERDD